MKKQKIVVVLTVTSLAAWLVGCSHKPDLSDAAKAPEYGENAASTVTNGATKAIEGVKTAATNTITQALDPAKAVATQAIAEVKTAIATPPAGAVRYNAQPAGSKATVAGDSSIHAWTMETGVVGGYMEVDPNFPESALSDPAAAKPIVSVYVPVRSLKSGKTAMDERMQDTMSATNYPKFEYSVIELKPKSPAGTTGPLQFEAVGKLTIVGKTVSNSMPVTIEKKDGKLHIAGSTQIKLTQFDIPPPTIKLPLVPDIKVYDDLKIDFSWTLAPKKQ